MKINYILLYICFGIVNNFVFPQQKTSDYNYLNESLPDSIPVVFGKVIISTKDYVHSSPEFAPDYDEIYWSLRVNGEYGKEIIKYIIKENSQWSDPKIPLFSAMGKGDLYPTFSKDGKELYFTSDRLAPNSADSLNRFIWKVQRNGKEWSAPKIVGFDSLDIYSLSISSNGTLFFMAQLVKDRETMNYDIYSSQLNGGQYINPEKLHYPISSENYEDGPFISEDEQFIIFESNKPGGFGKLDLYISKKNKEGEWTEPKNLGNVINSESSERFPYLSPDGKYFFFASNKSGYNYIYWVDSKIIYKLIEK